MAANAYDLWADRGGADLIGASAGFRLDNSCHSIQDFAVSRHANSFPSLKPCARTLTRVSAGNYGHTSDYIRDLVRMNHDEQAKRRLRDLIEEGLASGTGVSRSKADTGIRGLRYPVESVRKLLA